MPFYLYHGNDLKLLKKQTDFFESNLKKHFPDLEVISFSDNITLPAVLDKMTSSSLFSSKQLLKVYEIEKLNWIEKITEYETEAEVLLISYKETPPLKNKKKISLESFNLPRNYELEKIIPPFFKQQISPEAVDYLSKNISSILDLDDLKQIMQEHQLAFLDLETIYKIKGDTEAKIFLIIEDIFNQKLSSIAEVNEFLDSGGYIGLLINLLNSQLEKFYTIKKLQAAQHQDKEIAEKLKISPFLFTKLKKTLQLYSLKKLENLCLLLPKMDFHIRYYDNRFAHYFLEKFILDLAEK